MQDPPHAFCNLDESGSGRRQSGVDYRRILMARRLRAFMMEIAKVRSEISTSEKCCFTETNSFFGAWSSVMTATTSAHASAARSRSVKCGLRGQPAKVSMTWSRRSAHNRVGFSYSGVRAEHVEEQAYVGADYRCAEAGGGRPEGGRRSPGVRGAEAYYRCLEDEVWRDGRDRGAGSQAVVG